ncbi:MAG: hypothetical protein OJF49_002377 [Ktedonobacterales bacterium]|jgi:hypothetical protein|nr:MAG: hypothetical protein OJF49_002377 [Ktedonobacterales bacterium]
MRKLVATLFVLMVTLSLSACFPGQQQASAPLPTPDTALVSAISHKVAALYGESNPQIVSVKADVTVDSTHAPMDSVFLTGSFQKGTLHATHLSFSMLASGKQVWAVRASDDTNQTIWIDDSITV